MTAGAGGPAVPPASVWNVANALTILRLILVPVFALLLLHDGGRDPWWRVAAWTAFAVAAVTDVVDGHLARRRGLVTDFGAFADPVADKALVGAALIGLSVLGELSWWVTIVIAIREIGVTALRFWVIRYGVIPATRGGKLKTVLQILAITWYIWPFPPALAVVGPVIMAAALAVTLVTGVDYLVRALRVRRSGSPDKHG